MRTISISTDVFAAIWAARKEGEESENVILSRLLVGPISTTSNFAKLTTTPPQSKPLAATENISGYFEPRYNVKFAEGEEIFRTYKGKEYRARATQGAWLLINNKKLYPSLHKLSWSVVGGRENAWLNWKYESHDGKAMFIHSLRPDDKIQRRNNNVPEIDISSLKLEDLDL
jgi:hypothetical protein